MKEILYDDLIKIISEKSYKIVDTRNSCAYIGWLIDGTERRGHIENSISISANWFKFLKEAVLTKNEKKNRKERLEKQISNSKLGNFELIILCDTHIENALIVKEYLEKNYNLNFLYFNINNWKGDLVYYPNFYKIVPPEWIYEVIQGKNPKFLKGNSYKIFECNWNGENITFLSSHIPQAVHIDTNEFEKSPEWICVSDDLLRVFLENNGITKDTAVILYSNGDQAAEYKTALVLEALGIENVYILNGGYEAWRMKKLPVEQGSIKKLSLKSEENFNSLSESPLFVSINEVKDIFEKGRDEQVIDIRAWEEYSARETGYDYISVKGRIPDAVYGGSWLDYKNIDDTMRDFEDIKDLLNKNKIDIHKRMIYFCGSAGWGAAMAVIYGQVAGNYNMAIFEGGWNEWVLDKSNKIDDKIL